MVSEEVIEMNPLPSVTGEVAGLTTALSPDAGDQVMDGAGTPLAVQVKVTIPPSSPVAVVLADGSVMVTAAVRIPDTSTA